jgi:hypothetical protein
MAGPSTGINLKRIIEWAAAITGAVNCAAVPLLFAPTQPQLFPLPGLYLLEIALLGLAVLVATAARPASWAKPVPWIAAGILLAFVILGGFSIGPFLIPALLLFVLAGLLADWQTGGVTGRHIGLFFIAAVVQAVLMGLLLMVAQ